MMMAYLCVIMRPPTDPKAGMAFLSGARIYSAPVDEITQDFRFAYLAGPSVPGNTFEEAKKALLAYLRSTPQWKWAVEILPEKDRE